MNDQPLTIAGQTFKNALGTHSTGLIKIDLKGRAQRFQAFVGLDDDVAGHYGSVLFSVLADQKEVFRIPVMVSETKAIKVDVNLKGVKQLDLWRGIEYIKENMKLTGVFPDTPVMIGEIGIPGNQGTIFGIPEQVGKIVKDELVKRWDNAIFVFLAQDIPYVIQWGGYCNEHKAGVKNTLVHTTDEMRGFWLIRPDNTYSFIVPPI